MKTMSRTAIAAALFASVGGLALTAPAIAKEKKEEAKAPGLKLSKEIVKQASEAQTALNAKDYATAEPLVAQVEAGAKTDDDRYISSVFRYMLAAGKMTAAGGAINESQLVGPLDALIANPKTPATDLPRFVFQRGVIAYNAKKPQEALTFFQRAQQLGYSDPNLALQLTKLKFESGDIAGGSAELQKTMAAQTAAGTKPEESLYRYAIAQTHQKKMGAETTAWLKRYAIAYPNSKTWRDVAFTYGLQQQGVVTLDKGQKVDLYRLLRQTKSLADQYDYEIYAQFAIDLGLPHEAKAVLAEGKAAGKIPADSATANDLMKAADLGVKNEGSLAPLEAKGKAGNAKLAASTGDVYLGAGDNAKAADLYRAALTKPGVDADTVNTRLGIALAKLGDKEGAKAAFAAVKTAPRAEIGALWTTYLDNPPTA
ncbi:tetratricopeptide repeat protein [Sphingomonas sp. SUN019]|uniref:tetratricopeptide repeat protein n=1 Tax=Sphingomonas sp. SUN019 TaxID=2937788 RepID=UPI002164B5C6|nr:tetratricopeptide repeat protein [Sphingomonas sp. SUN019]UVO49151.1 tetratricopeptide repeat protein [Sphingomonas sp. SUN019]